MPTPCLKRPVYAGAYIGLDDVLDSFDYRDVIYHVFPGTTLTVCCIKLSNGFTVTGESACIDPSNYCKTTGEKLAYEAALDKLWELLGFALTEKLAELPRGDRYAGTGE